MNNAPLYLSKFMQPLVAIYHAIGYRETHKIPRTGINCLKSYRFVFSINISKFVSLLHVINKYFIVQNYLVRKFLGGLSPFFNLYIFLEPRLPTPVKGAGNAVM